MLCKLRPPDIFVFDNITVLYGNNGSGKSTILNIIAHRLNLKGEEANGPRLQGMSNYFGDFVSMCDYERWRKGQVDYLERVCKGSISKLSDTIREIYKYAREQNLKIGTTCYMKYGKGNIKLRFTRYRNFNLEKLYLGTIYNHPKNIIKTVK